jgi:hypothetical protein
MFKGKQAEVIKEQLIKQQVKPVQSLLPKTALAVVLFLGVLLAVHLLGIGLAEQHQRFPLLLMLKIELIMLSLLMVSSMLLLHLM